MSLAASKACATELFQDSFQGRTISVVNDLTIDEQLYLYHQTRLLKEAVKEGKDLTPFRVMDASKAVYLIFMEDSTRTKESFRNAACFHGCKVNVFDAATSSFNKKESITDTVKMLCGYSTEQSLFVVRSKLEGTCTWLADVISRYCIQLGVPRASFLNAGDGRHEHPTQEFLDEFSFLEQLSWDRKSIHLALVGDLFHGRTVHSKADGLRVFEKVRVDLVAPEDLTLPGEYEQKMKENGFEIRKFPSLDAYLAHKDAAPIWYFTRLQLERMGEKVLGREEHLRRAVTFRKDMLDIVPQSTRFYHPLPRHQKYPVIPTWLDSTPFNAWDAQSVNGYFTRIIELAMCAGKLDPLGGAAATSPSPRRLSVPGTDFVKQLISSPKAPKPRDDMKIGIKPVTDGIVIDHLGVGADPEKCWRTIFMIHKILGFGSEVGSCGVFASSTQEGRYKGIISLPGLPHEFFDPSKLKRLAAIAPDCTLNMIKGSAIELKYQLNMPPRVYDFADIDCKNPLCISHRANHENATAYFVRQSRSPPVFACLYCERHWAFEEIWAI
eukprot:TRINITY_DN18394_c0_g1_i1.p1 TRINITY_DN18394_c0_g1~~TRINITY_DN18394_c0_g1_i1.p1  ORF type:complete len:578 (+),score=221.85 TRINITY_DN18394_c0_g1_i1:81-1736(+)